MMGGDIIENQLCATLVHKLNPLYRLVRVYSVGFRPRQVLKPSAN